MKMKYLKKKKDDETARRLINTVLEAVNSIWNGSVKIIKQDNVVIQINLNEIVYFNELEAQENIAKGA